MILILDHANAILVGSFIFLMILSLQSRVQAINVEQTANYVLKSQASDLANWMEEDILSLGANMNPEKDVPFTNPVDSAGQTTSFTFSRDSLDLTVDPPDTVRIATRYELVRTGTKEVNKEEIDVYRIQRSQRIGSGAWAVEGGSAALLGSFRIDMLDADAQPVANPVAAAQADPKAIRNTRVRFSMVTPFETTRTTVRQAYYGSTLLIAY